MGPDTAVITFNARGVGNSQGSQPWPGAYPGQDHLDFAAVEEAGRELTGAAEVYRLVSVGYHSRMIGWSSPYATPHLSSFDGR